MDEVATAAGISRKSLFLYFPSKGDLIWHRSAPYLETLDRDLALSMEAGEQLGAAMVDVIVAGYREGPERANTLRAMIRLYAADDAVRDLVESHGGRWRAIFSSAAERAGTSILIADVIGHGFWRAMWLAMEDWEANGGDFETKVRQGLNVFAAVVPALLEAGGESVLG